MLSIRKEIQEDDASKIKEILLSTGFFDQSPDEVDVALELLETAIRDGNNVQNYQFLFAEEDGQLAGYSCFARVPCTISTFEIYWLCVDKQLQGKGIGRFLIDATLTEVKANGGTKTILQTAGREQYRPTQQFYLSCGFKEEARLKDYYTIGDDCLIFSI